MLSNKNNLTHIGSGCSAAVEHSPRNFEVVGSNPAGHWAFSLLLYFLAFYLRVSFIKEVHLYEMGKFKKNEPSCAALGETGFISSDWGLKSGPQFFPTTVKYSH